MAIATDVPVAQKVLWTLRDLQALTGLCRATIERMVARGELPRPTKIGKRNVWNAADTRAALEQITRAKT